MPRIAETPAHRLLVFAVAGGLLALHLAMASRMQTPMLFADETAYLGMARYLAGEAPDLRLANRISGSSPFMATGYSLLLVPAVALAGSAAGSYRAALVVNSLCAAGTFVLLVSFARRVLALSPPRAVAAALVASLYPALLLQSNLSWSESLLFLLLPAVVLAFLRLAEQRSMAAALLFATLTGYTYWVHQRTIGLIPLALAALWLLCRRGLPRSAATAGTAALLLLTLAARGMNAWVWERLCAGGAREGEVDTLLRLLQPEGLLESFRSAVGQLWYLAAATMGAALLGGWLLAWRAAQPAPDDEPRRWAAGYALACWGILFLTSSIFVVFPDRADKLIYGRYWEPGLSLLLTAAVARFWKPGKAVFAPPAIAALVLAGLGLALVSLREGRAFQQVFNQLTVLGITHWVLRFGSLRILWITLISAIVALALLALARRPAAGAWVLGLLFLGSGLYTFQTWMVPVNRFAVENLRIPAEIQRIPGVEAVAFDEAYFSPGGFSAYPFWLDGVRLLWFDSRGGRQPPAELVIASRDWSAPASARIVYPENTNGQALWVLPGELQDRLAAAGVLLPADPEAPLPEEACRAGFELLEDPGPVLRLKRGSSRTVRLRLTHRGHGAPWVSAAALGTPANAVRIAIQWLARGAVVADRRSELLHTMSPGGQVDLDLVLDPSTGTGEPLPPGLYEVRISVLQELVRFFDGAGDGSLTLQAEVRDGSRLADLF